MAGMSKDYAKIVEKQIAIAEKSICPVCGKRCLNEYNLMVHRKAKHE